MKKNIIKVGALTLVALFTTSLTMQIHAQYVSIQKSIRGGVTVKCPEGNSGCSYNLDGKDYDKKGGEVEVS